MQVHLKSSSIEAGSSLSGRFLWQPNTYDNQPNKITVRMIWFTEGCCKSMEQVVEQVDQHHDVNDNDHLIFQSEMQISDRITFGGKDGRALRRGWLPFTFTVPQQGPITYDGALLRIVWQIHVVVNWPGLFNYDIQTETFAVVPRSLV